MLKFLMTLLGDHKVDIVEFNQSNEFREIDDDTLTAVRRELTGKSTITIVTQRKP